MRLCSTQPSPVLLATALLSFVSRGAVGAGTIASIGRINEKGTSWATWVSDDGHVVGGGAYNRATYQNGDYNDKYFVVRWTASGGLENWGIQSSTYASATCGSADGSVLGCTRVDFASPYYSAFTMTAPNTAKRLGGGAYAQCAGVSADGGSAAYFASYTESQGTHAYIRSGDQITEIGPGFYGDQTSVAALSADGSTAVGTSNGQAYRWTRDLGRQTITLPGTEPAATALARNSAFIAGTLKVNSTRRAYVLEPDGTIGLFDAPANSSPKLVSNDGRIIIFDGEQSASIWVDRAPVTLNDYLAQHGVDLTGWGTLIPAGMSPDGLTFVGNSNGVGFVATIPAPGAVIMALIPGLLVFSKRRARSMPESQHSTS